MLYFVYFHYYFSKLILKPQIFIKINHGTLTYTFNLGRGIAHLLVSNSLSHMFLCSDYFMKFVESNPGVFVKIIEMQFALRTSRMLNLNNIRIELNQLIHKDTVYQILR